MEAGLKTQASISCARPGNGPVTLCCEHGDKDSRRSISGWVVSRRREDKEGKRRSKGEECTDKMPNSCTSRRKGPASRGSEELHIWGFSTSGTDRGFGSPTSNTDFEENVP